MRHLLFALPCAGCWGCKGSQELLQGSCSQGAESNADKETIERQLQYDHKMAQ